MTGGRDGDRTGLNRPGNLRSRRAWLLIGLLTLGLSSCSPDPTQREQRWQHYRQPFFAPIDRAYSQLQEETDPDRARALLRRFQPRVFLSSRTPRPLDFHRDVVPNFVYRDVRQRWDPWKPFQAGGLAQHARSWFIQIGFAADPVLRSSQLVAYGRVFYDTLELLPGGQPEQLTILKYNFVFPHSGLPARLPGWRRLVALLGNPRRWHWLDIHGAFSLVLDARQRHLAILLSQHNHHRTYLLSTQSRPAGDSPGIVFSLYSHEPYLYSDSPQGRWEPAIASAHDFAFLLRQQEVPREAGYDYVPGHAEVRQVDYSSLYLPPTDPLYTAQIPLGPAFRLLGMLPHGSREAPPGTNYATWPQLLPYRTALPFWYMHQPEDRLLSLLQATLEDFDAHYPRLLEYNLRRRLQQDWRKGR